MALDLKKEWGKLKLEVLDADDTSSNHLDFQIALCLVGNLLTKTTFNADSLKNTLRNAWRPVNGLIVKDLNTNLFAFQFFSETDRDFVLNKGPWAFDVSVLLLKQMIGLEQPSEMNFSKANFWIKACYLLVKKKTYDFTASKFGDFVDVDEEDVLAIPLILVYDKLAKTRSKSKTDYSSMEAQLRTLLEQQIEAQNQKIAELRIEQQQMFAKIMTALEKDKDSNDEETIEAMKPHGKGVSPMSSKAPILPTYRPGPYQSSLPNSAPSKNLKVRVDIDVTKPLRRGDLLCGDGDEELRMNIRMKSVDYLNCGTDDPRWRFIGLYGWLETQNKLKTCELLLDLKNHSSLLWIVGGDFNEILFNMDKLGGPSKPQYLLDKFQDTLDAYDLFDLGFVRRQFTWWNGQSGQDYVEEQLDVYVF
ncbi:hypothetical protein Cgig2_009195 [Carnegiea gigantea]|uniref:DUF4283 domain-containing protein n=1 Tax=Carnegiea gigantea TaxID=171969 RepID=A0A9Q1GR82_9CARY|nr:hypothetical protein Cgig2_009195 [Carnegiea gigantea]